MHVRTALVVITLGGVMLAPTIQGQDARRDTLPVRLAPTRHAPLPADVSGFWYVPAGGSSDAGAPSAAVTGRIARGIRLINSGDFAGGLPLVNSADVGRSPLAAYAHYYAGVALTSLTRPSEADKAFVAAHDRDPDGHLDEALDLRMAEAALARGDAKRAVDLLDDLADDKPASPDAVLLLLGRAAEKAGDVDRALEAYRQVYYDLPLSAGAADAQMAIARLQTIDKLPPDKVKRDRERADALFAGRRWAEARAAYEPLARVLKDADGRLVALRIAACDYYLNRFRAARDAAAPLLGDDRLGPEARFIHLSATRGLGDTSTFIALTRRLADEHPESPWTEEALNALASHYIRADQDDDADGVFRLMLASAPRGRYADRAAWQVGWRAYRNRDLRFAAETFERAAATFPRADYRPSWLYWSARARDLLNDSSAAVERYTLVIADYGSSYYGRLATAALGNRRTPAGTITIALTSTGADRGAPADARAIPTAALIRDLIAAKLYEEALREVQYAQRQWGDSAALQATTAYIRHHQGVQLRAEERFTAVRGAINTMRRAYPQFMTAGGDELPAEVLRIIFPIDYWPLIAKYSKQHDLDPYLVAALMAQESTFTAEIRSSANAYGLMQIIPTTGRHVARKVGVRNFTTRMLTDPETNVRLGTQYFKDLMTEFGGAHFALAGYNAGEGRVRQWRRERPPLPADEFTDDIPFAETQAYVKRILGTAEDYRRLYGGGLLDPHASLSAQGAEASRALAVTPVSSRSTPRR